jgi:5-oxoprolinase (ATP-hydrolysing) subunit A
MPARVWLNVDLGELPDEPEPLYACAHVANVACGGHAGDESSMRRAVDLCAIHGAALGAHPSYPDREGFGRRRLAIGMDALRRSVGEQCARLASIAQEAGASIAFVKPHGALYHAAHDDRATAEAIVLGAMDGLGTRVGPAARLTIIGPPGGALESIVSLLSISIATSAAPRPNLAFAREGFADRATRPDGTLVPRGEPGALVLDPAAAATRADALVAAGGIDTICVHGDTPGAVAVASAVRAVLDSRAGA